MFKKVIGIVKANSKLFKKNYWIFSLLIVKQFINTPGNKNILRVNSVAPKFFFGGDTGI